MKPALLAAVGAAVLTLAACATTDASMEPAMASLAPPHAPIVQGQAVPVVAATDQLALLASDDPRLAANKRLVFDFWRTLFGGGRVEVIDEMVDEGYIDHNPTAHTGRAALKALFSQFLTPQDEIPPTISNPLVTILAEGDYVTMAFVDAHAAEGDAPAYTTTHFELFRIANGRIAEHWDSDFRSEGQQVDAPEDGGPVPVTGVEGDAQMALVQDDDPALFANKRLVFDLWRHTVDAGREAVADIYLDPIYIQHNPNAATGRQGFKDYMSGRDDLPIETHYLNPLVAMIAEGDLVVQAVAEERPVPGGAPGETYTVAHFDMFRIKDGRIIEHWDNAARGQLPARLEEEDG